MFGLTKKYSIAEIFRSFQGEGPYTGESAIFIRLSNCNLTCSFCDTNYTTKNVMSTDEIISEVTNLASSTSNKDFDFKPSTRTANVGEQCHPRNNMVKNKSSSRHNNDKKETQDKVNFIVLTGGEPLLQPVEHLCKKLLEHKYKIQIETNGTVFRNLDDQVKIICSPKNVNGKFLINKKMLAHIDALKFVVSKTFPGYQTVPDIGQDKYNIPIYIQPMDEGSEEKNKDNLKYVIDMCLEEKYKLSLQMHKLVGAR